MTGLANCSCRALNPAKSALLSVVVLLALGTNPSNILKLVATPMSCEDMPMLCVDCIANHGLRVEAAKLAQPANADQRCAHCGDAADVLATTDQIDQLLERFFVHGSTAATGRWQPIYRLGLSKLDSDRPRFDRTLRRDFDLLRTHSSSTLFLNAPSTWRLGHTEVGEKVSESLSRGHAEAAVTHIDRVIDHCTTTILTKGTNIFRVRRNVELIFDENQYDTSPHASASRFSDGSVPVLYGALDVETCIHEARVMAEDEVTVATLRPTRDLRVIDLTDVPFDDPPETGGEGGDIFYFVNARLLFGARSAEAHAFGRRAAEQGFDGVVYPSFFSDVRPHRARLPNVAIFGNPIRDHRLQLQSLNNLRIDTIAYEYTFGPVTKSPSPKDADDVLEAMRLSADDPKRIVERIEEIIARSDPPE